MAIAVARSSTCCISAPRAGSVVSVLKSRPGVVVGPADEVVELGQPRHEPGELRPRRSRRPCRVRFGELRGERVGLVEQRVHAGFARLGQQRRQVPDDVFGRQVGRGHVAPFASASVRSCAPPVRASYRSDQEVEEAVDEVERSDVGERNPARVGGVVAGDERRRIADGVAKKSRIT